MYGTKLQKWEQITTVTRKVLVGTPLWCMVQSYKNESKSQLVVVVVDYRKGCDVWYKVTKMRANHNQNHQYQEQYLAVMYGTKLQKWEQITTSVSYVDASGRCDVWYKVTKMRANHNILLI